LRKSRKVLPVRGGVRAKHDGLGRSFVCLPKARWAKPKEKKESVKESSGATKNLYQGEHCELSVSKRREFHGASTGEAAKSKKMVGRNIRRNVKEVRREGERKSRRSGKIQGKVAAEFELSKEKKQVRERNLQGWRHIQ